ncbi:MAG: hypothetical protein U1A07_03105 [Phenylobacterium sp.]|nr:hypothetical protein [Phenylobacterium sp.]
MLRAALGLLLAILAAPAMAAGLTEASVRQFLAGQESAWNERRLDTYFAGFTGDAVFVDQTVTPKETITYGRSTVAEARAFARKATSRSTERGTVRRITIARTAPARGCWAMRSPRSSQRAGPARSAPIQTRRWCCAAGASCQRARPTASSSARAWRTS